MVALRRFDWDCDHSSVCRSRHEVAVRYAFGANNAGVVCGAPGPNVNDASDIIEKCPIAFTAGQRLALDKFKRKRTAKNWGK